MRAVLLLLLLCFVVVSSALTRVVVTGGAGKTGKLVFKKLLERTEYEPLAVVRTEDSRRKLVKETGCKESNVAVADTTDMGSLTTVMTGQDKLILCTSAVPKLNKLSIVKTLLLKLIGKKGGPKFSFRENGSPYNVDYLGAKNQFDAAKTAGLKQVVVIGSMGGTQPDNFLNTIGKIDGDDTSGNILLWKRKAEQYLIKSGLCYTIIHPGGLLDKPSGEREIVFGVDDQLLKEKVRSIPRGDVAEVCVQALGIARAGRRSFDVISREGGPVTSDWEGFFSNKGDCKYEA